ncbi:ribose 5-phosphate isomerase B [Candidatus Gracilibacteria bacterium]|nr:ribose 5-phosphate isomerase B [Candidatus Gracilibacteria bacterium]
MKIFIGSDHGGFLLKQKIKDFFSAQGKHQIVDLGPKSSESVDYPVFGKKVGEAVVEIPGSLGIVLCGSGIGISIAANKVKGVRCALCNSKELAKLGREHNEANVLAMGERTQSVDDPLEIVETFISTEVDKEERHERRRAMLNEG